MHSEKLIEDNGNKEFTEIKSDSGSVFWILKKFNEGDFQWSVGQTKTEADRSTENELGVVRGKPHWITLGLWDVPHLNYEVNSIPGIDTFLYQNLPFYDNHEFLVYSVKFEEKVCIIFYDMIHPESDCYYLTTDSGHSNQEKARKILFQFILDMERGFDLNSKKRNIKLKDWLNLWYSKLKAEAK